MSIAFSGDLVVMVFSFCKMQRCTPHEKKYTWCAAVLVPCNQRIDLVYAYIFTCCQCNAYSYENDSSHKFAPNLRQYLHGFDGV